MYSSIVGMASHLKITNRLAGTIKLPFRKLNSILSSAASDVLERRGPTSIAVPAG
jgi:hypothetical protein